MNRSKLLSFLAAALLAAACSQTPAPPAEADAGATCALDGMQLGDFPGPKGQIVYDQGPPDFFCNTLELVSIWLQPEQHRRVVAIYAQDMGKAAWEAPQGNWIDGKTAFYVAGSRKTGAMGRTLATFARESDAQAFARANGGRVLRLADFTPDMVALDGGVLKDTRRP